MKSRWLAPLFMLVAAGGAAWAYWQRRLNRPIPVEGQRVVEAPKSATSFTSLSAQPHKRVRIAPPQTPELENRPAPDSAESGRTPYYFVPGEAVITLYDNTSVSAEFLPLVAETFGAVLMPMGTQSSVSYPAPENEGWFTLVRLRWESDTDYEASLTRFKSIEAQVNQELRWETIRVAGWMPNWLGTVANADTSSESRMFTPGGAGSYPRSVSTPPHPTLPMKEAPFLMEWRGKMNEPVTLVIADAFPAPEAFTDTMVFPPSLVSFVEKVRALPDILTVKQHERYATFREGTPYDMASHGLMTAWLATEVIGVEAMAQVTLEPIRVATGSGVCAIVDVLAGIAPLAERARNGENIVALLAFTIGMGDIIPPLLRHYEEHYEGLRLCCLAISEAGGILMGAAGNDANGLQHPPRTRIPAKFRSIIEVTSGQYDQEHLALYANQSKALCLFGGDVNLANQSAENIPMLIGPVLPSEEHPTGWVAWAGTSFAAALAAGLAVLIRSDRRHMKMWDIRMELRSVAMSVRHPGNVPFIDIVEVSQ
jgi:hypothetical protein